MNSEISKIFLKSRPSKQIFTLDERKVLRLLLSDPSIVIIQVDKIRTAVILYLIVYINNNFKHLQDQSIYMSVSKEITPTIERKLNSKIKNYEKVIKSFAA